MPAVTCGTWDTIDAAWESVGGAWEDLDACSLSGGCGTWDTIDANWEDIAVAWESLDQCVTDDVCGTWDTIDANWEGVAVNWEDLDECPVEAPSQAPRGGDPIRRRRRKETFEKEGIDRRKLEEQAAFRRELERVYDELHGISPPEAPEVVAEAKAIIAPFAAAKPKKALPAPSLVDFEALSRDLAAARELIALHEDFINDEEEAYFMLLAA